MELSTLGTHLQYQELALLSASSGSLPGPTLDALAALAAVVATGLTLCLGALLAVLVHRSLARRYKRATDIVANAEVGTTLMASVEPATVRRLKKTPLTFPSVWARVLVARHVVILTSDDGIVVQDTRSGEECEIPWRMIDFVTTETRSRQFVPWHYISIRLKLAPSPVVLLFLAGAGNGSAQRSFVAAAERTRLSHPSKSQAID